MKVILTGASGAMGSASLKEIVQRDLAVELVLLALDRPSEHRALAGYEDDPQIRVAYGDLTDATFVQRELEGADLVLHLAAMVSPEADYAPERTIAVNTGGMRNILRAIQHWGQETSTHLVSIGTIAMTGDRMPGIHWGRVGDPLKPSMFDYYALSKIAAERAMIEAGLSHWVSLRQTGMMGPNMADIQDPIMFHCGLDNVLEYVSDRDSGRLMANILEQFATGQLPETFWNHVYNIGGGKSCYLSGRDMFQGLFERLGFEDMDDILTPKLFATHNFHGHYFLDSDQLEDLFAFRRDDISYFFDCLIARLGWQAKAAQIVNRSKLGQKLLAILVRARFRRVAKKPHGTQHFIAHDEADKIDAFWGSRAKWEALPDRFSQFQPFSDWDHQIILDHGYDETKPAQDLSLADMQAAAVYRGGQCLSTEMTRGDWQTPLEFRCASGHDFTASPRLVLEGGHFCPVCVNQSWNYGQRAKREPFLDQVWAPLHDPDEVREYPNRYAQALLGQEH